MPTVPPEDPARTRHQPHRHRREAESFGVDPARYDRARPRYPDAMVSRILAGSPGRHVLDVGCGTGIDARQFRAAGATVLGIDPDARMAEFARGTGIEVEVATFEAWEPGDRVFDAVVAGQSWHWVEPVAGLAKAARVLTPGGRLAVFGHVFDPPAPVSTAFSDAYLRVVPDPPWRPTQDRPAVDVYTEMLTRVTDGIRQTGGFAEPEIWRFDWEQTYTREEWLDHLPTTGLLTRLPADDLAEVLGDVGEAIDGIGGAFTMSYVTLAATAVRSG